MGKGRRGWLQLWALKADPQAHGPGRDRGTEAGQRGVVAPVHQAAWLGLAPAFSSTHPSADDNNGSLPSSGTTAGRQQLLQQMSTL